MIFKKDVIKIDSKELHSLQGKKKKIDNHFYDLMDQYQCANWPGYYSGNVKHLEDRFQDCPKSFEAEEMIKVCREQEEAAANIQNFIETIYSKDIFEHYASERPQLIRNKTGEKVSWDQAFGNSFEKLGTAEKNALVGLIEGQSKYSFA